MADLEEAIRLRQEAVNATPEDHPSWVIYLDNLGTRLRYRYLRTGAIADLEEAIQIGREAVNATPKDHPARIVRLNHLGIGLSCRYSKTK